MEPKENSYGFVTALFFGRDSSPGFTGARVNAGTALAPAVPGAAARFQKLQDGEDREGLGTALSYYESHQKFLIIFYSDLNSRRPAVRVQGVRINKRICP